MVGIKIKPSHRGLLHSKLGVPEGEKISLGALMKAKGSNSPTLRKEATFANNARKFNRG